MRKKFLIRLKLWILKNYFLFPYTGSQLYKSEVIGSSTNSQSYLESTVIVRLATFICLTDSFYTKNTKRQQPEFWYAAPPAYIAFHDWEEHWSIPLYFLGHLAALIPSGAYYNYSPTTTTVARRSLVQALGMCESDLKKQVCLGCIIACLGGAWRGGHSAEELFRFTNQNIENQRTTAEMTDQTNRWIICSL